MKNDVRRSGPKPEKVCPITFHLDPVTSLQRNVAAAIEKTNAVLAQKLAGLRTSILGNRRVAPDYNEKIWVNNFRHVFKSTYLKDPLLWGDDGKKYQGWDQIVPYLKNLMPMTTYINPQSVNVYLEYLPVKSEKHISYNRGIYKTPVWDMKALKDLGDEIDFLASIRTVIAYAPYDDPMEIGNSAPIPHRKVCDPIF
ncbi:MAG: hypothetical protein MUQ25_01925 [Candidatus Aminicenantes bacterium]|nr:hypothetical protein [Candidatus Aminicenantes bacterium]